MRFTLAVVVALVFSPLVSAQDTKAPRRVLFVHVGNYLYLNPLTHAVPGGTDRVRSVADRLAAGFRVPTVKDNDQLFVLADSLTADARLPTKNTLAKTIDGFCATTREQDRVVLYFGMHAVEKNGKAYLVPIDGDPDAADTLLAVADVYARLKELKASQKVVIWDVGRYNPERFRTRRDPGPMTDSLFTALTTPPEGVQVLVSCSPGERAQEYFTPRGPAGMFAGSAYLDALRLAAADGPKTAPGDAIPVAELHKVASKSVAVVAGAVNAKQTPALAGTAPKVAAEYDPKAAPAQRFEWPAPPKSADVKSVLDELALPPVLDDDTGLVARLPFTEEALKGYATDVSPDEILKNMEKYPLRVATLRTLQAVRDVWPSALKDGKGAMLLSAPVTERLKKTISDAQQPLALALVKLEIELEALSAVVDQRARETKRWQAHYDYAVAEVRLRLVVLNEYNLLLARVRTETLPELPADATGWRLIPAAGLQSRRDVKEVLAAAQEGFAKVAADHKGTPWEVLAKRSQAFVPGLRWEAVVPPK